MDPLVKEERPALLDAKARLAQQDQRDQRDKEVKLDVTAELSESRDMDSTKKTTPQSAVQQAVLTEEHFHDRLDPSNI